MIDKSTPFLSREAKIGDVLAVTASLAVIAAAPIGCCMFMAIGKFDNVYMSLHMTLPLITRLVLEVHKELWIPMLHLLLATVVVWVLVRVRNPRIKVTLTGICLALCVASIAVMVIGLALPILEFGAQMS
jgi:hypothetical protein